MKRSNVKCPVCGYINEGVDLEETKGGQNAASVKLSLWHPVTRSNFCFQNYLSGRFRNMFQRR